MALLDDILAAGRKGEEKKEPDKKPEGTEKKGQKSIFEYSKEFEELAKEQK